MVCTYFDSKEGGIKKLEEMEHDCLSGAVGQGPKLLSYRFKFSV